MNQLHITALKLGSSIKATLTIFIAASLFGLTPLSLSVRAFADEPCAAPVISANGVRTPTGADSGTFVYQCAGEYTGLYTNAYYVYDPITNTRTALYPPNYSYDCTTKAWTMDAYSYTPAQASYTYYRSVTDQPYGYAPNCPVATPVGSTGSTSNGPSNAINPGATIDPTSTLTKESVPGSSGSTSNLSLNNGVGIGNTTNANLNNYIGAVALSGSAGVIGNTTGGSATTGNAIDQANVLNLLQSNTNLLGAGRTVATFTANINGDVNGDLLFDPATIGSLQNANGTTDVNNNLTVNNSLNAAINNTIDLKANSGNATVASNTTGGDATTGSAQAIANVMNYINSSINSGQSFVGTININGNLNGDILLPADLIDQLIASNVPTVSVAVPSGPGTNNTNNTTVNNSVVVNNTNNQNIANNVTSAAQSGNAKVADNTTGGNASTGQATTNVTAFNLTGSDVIGTNDILVFVNVLGKWVGMIVNAPAGATAASLGGGITRNTTVDNSATLNNTVNGDITNNINVAAKSGDATVKNNTSGGDAKTGNAKTAVNLLNVQGSKLDISNWFGILFINVFGTWQGSFGVNTSAGDSAIANAVAAGAAGGTGVPEAATPQVFRFVPRPGSSTASFVPASGNTGVTSRDIISPNSAVLAAHTTKLAAAATDQAKTAAQRSNFKRTATIISLAVVAFIVFDAVVSSRRRTNR